MIIFESEALYRKNMPWYLEEIAKCTYRQFTTGFYFGKPNENTQIYDNNTYIKEYTYLGVVGSENEEGDFRLEQKNKFSVGEEIEIMKPKGENELTKVLSIKNEEGESQESAPHPQQIVYIKLDKRPEQYDLLRKKED